MLSFNQTFKFNSPSIVAEYRVQLKSGEVGLHFFSSLKLLWRVFGTVSERNTYKLYHVNTRVELSRALWNSQSALVSIRILPDLVSSSPFPSPLPRFLVLELPKRDLGTRSQKGEASQCRDTTEKKAK